MAEDAQSVVAAAAAAVASSSASKLLSDTLPTSSSASAAFNTNVALLNNLTATYNKLNLCPNKMKATAGELINGSSAEDYNNNTIESSLGKSYSAITANPNDQSCVDHYSSHFISSMESLNAGGNSADKWNSLRSDSPFLGNVIMSPPPPPQPSSSATAAHVAAAAAMAKSLCTNGNGSAVGGVAPGTHPSMQLLLGNGSTANGSAGKCSANGCVTGGSVVANGGVLGLRRGENCMIHAMPNTLWCLKCHMLICRACAGSDEHRNHSVKTQAKEAIRTEIATELAGMQKSLVEVQHLVLKQRDFLLKTLESCSALKSHIENELINHSATMDVAELRDSFCRAKLCLNVLDQSAANHSANGGISATASSTGATSGSTNGGSNATSPTSPTSPTPIDMYKLYTNLSAEKQRLQLKYQDLYLQCKFDDLLRNSGQVVDYDTINRAVQTLHIGGNNAGHEGTMSSGPLLLVANYCLTQIYTRQSSKQQQLSGVSLQSLASGHSFAKETSTQFPPFLDNHSSLSLSSSSAASAFGGAKSPFLDLAVGSPASSSATAGLPPHLTSGSHSLSFSQQSQASTNAAAVAAASQLLGSSFNHSFADNLLLSNAFQTSNGSAGSVGSSSQHTLHHHHPHHSLSSSLSAMRHSAAASAGAGGISFEMNGISVPISMISSQKFPGASSLSQHHHPHHHHLLHSAAATLSSSSSNSSGSNSIICNPTVHIYPIYYFNIEINGQPCGRILIEVRNDVAPRMAKNFGALASGELGFGYKGCQIFQCWENESIITGDFELNNGRGGRSVFEDGFFMPDDTKILAIRGSVGMRRSQKRHDNMGLVGSQFRIILREMRGFTGIFAFVIEGLDLVEKISQTGDSAGKPQSSVMIVSCGKLQ